MTTTYTTIDRPYSNNLERSDSFSGSDNSSGGIGSTGGQVNNTLSGSGEKTITEDSINPSSSSADGIVSGQSSDNIWIKNWIKSNNYKPKSQGFIIDGLSGYIECMKLYVGNGGIVGGKLDIPDETTANSFHVSSSGNTWWGANVADGHTAADAYVLNTGVVRFQSGTIGGCVLAATNISSTSFVSGPLGSGWRIANSGIAELQDVTIRGTIRTSVFEKDTISAVNGMVMVSSSDVLASDMTALDASTLTIGGETTFSANEILRIKDGTDDEWLMITDASSAPVYTVTRDLAGSYSADSNPIWKKGTAVVSTGVGSGSKTGYVVMDSSSQYSPFMDVYGRNSTTYTDTTLHARLGWLKGITDTDLGLDGTDTWGLYTDNAYIKGKIVVGTNGFVSGGQTDFQSTGDTGFFLGYSGGQYKLSIGQDSSGDNYLTWDGTYLRIKGNLDLTSIFNNISYATADLPIPPTTEGYNSPSGYEY